MTDSILQVNQIKDKDGNATGITVADTTANVTINNLAGGAIGSAVTGFTGIKVIDQWYITAGFTGVSDPITSNLSRLLTSGSLGSPMTQSSGVFTFPMTGKYMVKFHANQALNGSSRYTSIVINANVSGTITRLAKSYNYLISSSAQTKYTSTHIEAMYDVVDTSTHKVQFSVDEDISGSVSYNSSGTNPAYYYTYMQFIRLGDT